MSCPFAQSPRSTPNRIPKRSSSERDSIYEVIDAAPLCHVGFTQQEQPFVIPTLHARSGDTLLFHGSTQSRLLQAIASGRPICCVFTLLDGIVAARSAMHHSMNYRSVVAFGTGRLLEDEALRQQAFRLTTEKLLPGRWETCRQPNEAEAKATAIAALMIEEATLKQRSGGPNDIESDLSGPFWAGVLPIQTVIGKPIPADDLPPGVEIPSRIASLTTSG
ncbi:pyridoxamine 5'-phosphate oxidase family protein [Pelagicoccus sp. SDUM812003]|uniref:pyridoxamine 5'-phosphate oxidase family protein n=1 Tax=Pelagicoccus sp. SDUM812003 TaxID=3041267 RepID=UPI00280CA8E3|nr:pyridoxamine 5'-phosphate oxidase family protein [Pelagicoccus sp. SDUM812003]MDQ8203131.1 pyridoxamine 5'-phosphate oxidase family protein [Pelagicoccus sp. SDUM812003]